MTHSSRLEMTAASVIPGTVITPIRIASGWRSNCTRCNSIKDCCRGFLPRRRNHRQRYWRRHVSLSPGAARSECDDFRARRLLASGAGELGCERCLLPPEIRPPGDLVRQRGHAIPPWYVLLRWRQQQIVWRRDASPSRTGLRKLGTCGRGVASLADQLSSTRALL